MTTTYRLRNGNVINMGPLVLWHLRFDNDTAVEGLFVELDTGDLQVMVVKAGVTCALKTFDNPGDALEWALGQKTYFVGQGGRLFEEPQQP